jgi:hypothetical protein
VAAFQQLIGLPAGNQSSLDETIGHEVGIGDRFAARVLFQLGEDRVESGGFDQPAAPQKIDQYIYFRFGHACVLDPDFSGRR